MTHASSAIAAAIVGTIAMGPGSTTASAQLTVDLENKYANVGVIMVWRVDSAGKPVELRGFASGTLIRDRVMVTAGLKPARFAEPGTLDRSEGAPMTIVGYGTMAPRRHAPPDRPRPQRKRKTVRQPACGPTRI